MIDPAEFGVDTDRGASLLARILVLKAQEKALAEERAALEQIVRMELTNNPDPIVDGERGIVATLVDRNKPASIDLISMAKHPELEGMIVEAARVGLLSVPLTPLRAMRGKSPAVDSLMRFEIPGGITQVLEIKEA